MPGLTIRKLADVLRCSPSTLTSHLETKHRMVHLITLKVGQRVVDYVDHRGRRQGIDALVPADHQLPVVRTWLALAELARADDVTGGGVAALEHQLREAVRWACGLDAADEATTDALLAVTVGTWWAMCAHTDPIPSDRARTALRHACLALGAAPDAVA